MPTHKGGIWERAIYLIMTLSGPEQVDGIRYATQPGLGIHLRGDQRSLDVSHIPSGKRIAGFTSLGAAMSFVERIADTRPWFNQEVTFTDEQLIVINRVIEDCEATAFRPRTL